MSHPSVLSEQQVDRRLDDLARRCADGEFGYETLAEKAEDLLRPWFGLEPRPKPVLEPHKLELAFRDHPDTPRLPSGGAVFDRMGGRDQWHHLKQIEIHRELEHQMRDRRRTIMLVFASGLLSVSVPLTMIALGHV